MQTAEFILIAAGAILLVIAAYSARRRKTDARNDAEAQLQADLSLEHTEKLQASFLELIGELHELSEDMTLDLEEKLSELKNVLELTDKKLAEISGAGITEKLAEPTAPKPQAENKQSSEARDTEASDTPPNTPAPPPNNRYGEIYGMNDEGLPIDEIARRMNMGKGEIQLILSLRDKG